MARLRQVSESVQAQRDVEVETMARRRRRGADSVGPCRHGASVACESAAILA